MLLKEMGEPDAAAHPQLLISLVDAIRPTDPADGDAALAHLQELTALLQSQAALAKTLRIYLLELLAVRQHSHLYADTGILTNEGFFTTVRKRIAHRILPEEIRDDYLKDLFGLAFHRKTDYLWVEKIPDEAWFALLEVLDFDAEPSHPGLLKIQHEVLDAVRVLSYRIAATGLEHELVRNYPEIEKFESPFLAQNAEIHDYYQGYQAHLRGEAETPDDKHLLVLLDQCEEILVKVRKQARRNGASISLTYHVQRVEEMIRRMHTLLVLLDPYETTARGLALLRELVRKENRKYSVRDVATRVTDLVALQVTENAGKTGEHYAAATRAEYFTMLRSSMGAGIMVGIMALIKAAAGRLTLAPFTQAFLNSMNYSFGFMLIHVMHFTLATKQPAMTAATIAATFDGSAAPNSKGRAPLEGVVELIAIVMRTQLVSIFGNVLLAIPAGLAIAWAVGAGLGEPVMSAEKAAHALHDLDPFGSLALFHAAIAGVWLFLAGLISGYYDNECAYNRIPARLRQLRGLRNLIGERRLERFATYIENNLGALMGNFSLGIMLGFTGMIGFMLGLPIDVRHVTLSSANFAYALVALDFAVSWQAIAWSLLGIVLVGLVNLGVSFSLALYVATKARQVRFNRSGELLALLLKRFMKGPRDFVLPPKSDTAVEVA